MNKNKNKEEDRVKDQAQSQLESIRDMIKRLDHVRECDGDPEECEATNAEIYAGLNLAYSKGDKADNDDREEYHDEEKAREMIQEDPLSVQVRSDWHSPGDGNDKPMEYEILLCTGGPAVRIIGDLHHHHGEPETAQLEYQDWGTPWTDYPLTHEEEADVVEYALCFYFGQ